MGKMPRRGTMKRLLDLLRRTRAVLVRVLEASAAGL